MSDVNPESVEVNAAEEAITEALPQIERIEDLLTTEEREALHRDLAEMARLRRCAEEKSGQWVIP